MSLLSVIYNECRLVSVIQKHPFPMKKRITIAKVNKIQNKNTLELEKFPSKDKKSLFVVGMHMVNYHKSYIFRVL